MRHGALAAAVVAAVSFFVALAICGVALEGYSQLAHPVGLLGARGVPHALAFDAFGFVLPGLLAAWVAWRLREAVGDGARWPARIGAWLALLSALAFAAQGVLALDPGDLESSASRAHATAWTLWWVAFAPAALLLAFGVRVGRWFAAMCMLAAAVVIAFALLPLDLLAPALAQRAAFAGWLAWLVVAGWWVDASAREK
jgi:hypothetical protein